MRSTSRHFCTSSRKTARPSAERSYTASFASHAPVVPRACPLTARARLAQCTASSSLSTSQSPSLPRITNASPEPDEFSGRMASRRTSGSHSTYLGGSAWLVRAGAGRGKRGARAQVTAAWTLHCVCYTVLAFSPRQVVRDALHGASSSTGGSATSVLFPQPSAATHL